MNVETKRIKNYLTRNIFTLFIKQFFLILLNFSILLKYLSKLCFKWFLNKQIKVSMVLFRFYSFVYQICFNSFLNIVKVIFKIFDKLPKKQISWRFLVFFEILLKLAKNNLSLYGCFRFFLSQNWPYLKNL